MWNNLPSDLLSDVFSYLPPHSLARAMATCHHWHDCGRRSTTRVTTRHQHRPWFIAIPTRSSNLCFVHVHNPTENTWHLLNLKHVPGLTRPVSAIPGHGLVLFKSTGSLPLQLSVCDPFTGQFRHLPPLHKPRTNPAVGVIEGGSGGFKVYVAGGMSQAGTSGPPTYEPTLEMFDSTCKKWTLVGSIPVEFAIRLTVWTPNESVYSHEVIYWMTSARAYSIMGFEMSSNKWKELSVPMGDTLEFAAMVPRDRKLTVIGGTHAGNVSVWELGEGDEWNMIERMPVELEKRLIGNSSKCVGVEGLVCLYKEIAEGMVVWRRDGNDKNKWEWCWIEGCNQIGGKRIENYSIKGLLLHPNLASSSFF